MTIIIRLLAVGMLMGFLSPVYAVNEQANGGLDRMRAFHEDFKSNQERLRAERASAAQVTESDQEKEKVSDGSRDNG
ncbi:MULTISPECIES: hypothetical protein [Pseudomonadaceae]|uniref:hypothetical protein n=1 Tax=Pseudomonadaceae TaxID=135621 RepID=UPI0013015BF9|nr:MULTISPECIES: hypothetical protein [Pseudomonadaceae]